MNLKHLVQYQVTLAKILKFMNNISFKKPQKSIKLILIEHLLYGMYYTVSMGRLCSKCYKHTDSFNLTEPMESARMRTWRHRRLGASPRSQVKQQSQEGKLGGLAPELTHLTLCAGLPLTCQKEVAKRAQNNERGIVPHWNKHSKIFKAEPGSRHMGVSTLLYV